MDRRRKEGGGVTIRREILGMEMNTEEISGGDEGKEERKNSGKGTDLV
jgi:hypothetical protein